jgi:hypothetical protein
MYSEKKCNFLKCPDRSVKRVVKFTRLLNHAILININPMSIKLSHWPRDIKIVAFPAVEDVTSAERRNFLPSRQSTK